ncbi:hypothetical protein DEH84_13835 [Aquabacterium olei]|uniref:Class I SAM-dependent methyltransferase n=1 Tax=Aquabacterium olei TaxID=1296669 RepID=A0A2U8FVF4_9BURK|nr:methyltransferase domain-containing protein [Aquabacterium olei]AWI54384.1 hypothetical protein DEH84_13835 [Aquabacterium olei]
MQTKRYALLIKPKFWKLFLAGAKPTKILDLGIANRSYNETKALFPGAIYHGIDFVDHRIQMHDQDRFFQLDLEANADLLASLDTYDAIIANHVLEHLQNGDRVFDLLCKRLRPGGFLYVEFPSIKTAYKKKNRLNYHFHDDPTHKRFYSITALANTAIENQCRVLSCGPISTPLKDLLAIPRGIVSTLNGKGWGAATLHLERKIDHLFLQKPT